jgi:hypothetical protein
MPDISRNVAKGSSCKGTVLSNNRPDERGISGRKGWEYGAHEAAALMSF